MPRPWRIVYSGAKYHITSRGNARQKIFRSDDDYIRFLQQLQYCLEEDKVILYAYCLMPNHYHLLIETPLGNLKRFMQRLNTSYSMYYRYKHSKPGHCMQGRYGAKLVAGDDYILRLTRYIHLNPVKVKKNAVLSSKEKVRELEGFRWSSYRGYIGENEDFVNYRWLDLMHRKTAKGKKSAYRNYIDESVGENDNGFLNALEASRYAIGDDKFIKETEKDLKDQIEDKSVYGDVLGLAEKSVVDVHEIEKIVLNEYNIKAEDLMGHGNVSGSAKAVFVELCCRYSGKSQREVAGFLGYRSESSVTKQRKRFKDRLSGDDQLKKRLKTLADKVALSIVKV